MRPLDKTDSLSPLFEGEHDAAVNGITIHYYVRGTGPVLLLPSSGWGPSVKYIMPLPAFEKHFTMVYFDTRLCGGSTGPDDPAQYTLDHFVADIDALRIHLAQPKIFLAGHSGGGHQILEYASKYNDHLLGIIVIDAIAATDNVRGEEMMKRIAHKKSEPFYLANPSYYENAVAVMSGQDKTPRSLQETISIIGGFYFHNPELADEVFGGIDYSDKVFEYTRKCGFQGKNLLPELYKITVPALIIAGDDDFICDPITQATRIHEEIPSSKLVIIRDCGHIPWAEQPEQFYAACEEWFEEQNL